MINRLKKYLTRPKCLRAVNSGGDHAECFVLMFHNLEVGRLELHGQDWVFTYSEAFKHQDRVKPLVGFGEIKKTYQSSTLWPFFLVRVPSITQPCVQEFLREQGVKKPNEAMLLKRFGRYAITNPFELISQD